LKATDTPEEHLLKMMTTHDFEKIVLCINMFKKFSESGFVPEAQRREKIVAFLNFMFVSVPKYICKILGKHKENLKARKARCQEKIK
jgi:hypothetical protein